VEIFYGHYTMRKLSGYSHKLFYLYGVGTTRQCHQVTILKHNLARKPDFIILMGRSYSFDPQ
jgi:hypothetical protein